jgi:hypothetical protein
MVAKYNKPERLKYANIGQRPMPESNALIEA